MHWHMVDLCEHTVLARLYRAADGFRARAKWLALVVAVHDRGTVTVLGLVKRPGVRLPRAEVRAVKRDYIYLLHQRYRPSRIVAERHGRETNLMELG